MLLTLALPIVVQNLLVSSLNMVDTLMIGVIGENEVAAVGAANQYFFLLQMAINGIASGCSVFISQYWGAGNRESIHKILGIGIISMAAACVLFTAVALALPSHILGIFSRDPAVRALGADYLVIVCLSYLPTGLSFLFSNAQRSVGNALLPMLVSLGAILTNTGLNYLLIFGKLGLPVLGVKGAAVATLIARLLECVVLVAVSLRRSSPLRGAARSYVGFNRGYVKRAYATILPILLNEGCWGLGFVLYTVAYGFIGTHALAAANITNTVQNLFMVLCISIASAALVMIGNQIGMGREHVARRYAVHFSILAVALGVVLGAALFFCAPLIPRLFNITPEAAAASTAILRIYGVIFPVRMYNTLIIIGVLRGGGDAGYALGAEGITMWCIGVPLAFLGALAFRLPVEQVALLICAEEVAKCVFCALRIKSGRWLRSVTAPAAERNAPNP